MKNAAITIEKAESSGVGQVTLHFAEGWNVAFSFPEFIPFSKTNVLAKFDGKEPAPVKSNRQNAFENVISLYCDAYEIFPYRFIDKLGNEWRLETSAAHWAVLSGKFIWEKQGEDEFHALRRCARTDGL